MGYLSLAIGLVFMVLSTGGYVWYLEKNTANIENIQALSLPSPSKTSSSNTAQTNTKECAEFLRKFGTSAQELVGFVNGEPDSAIVLKGYLLIYAKITGLTPGSYLPVVLNLDSNGKITDYSCEKPQQNRNYSEGEVDVSIPETDLAQIIRYRETPETQQAVEYLQNMTTTPPEAKQQFLERLESLN